MSKYVNVQIIGGLGNQLFQIAMGLAYAKKYNLIPIFIRSEWLDRPTHWDGFTFRASKFLVDNLPSGSQVKHNESNPNYYELPSPSQLGNPDIIRFSGYFQSEKYFFDIRDDLLELFKPKPEKIIEFESKYSNFLNDIDNSGVLHIRRGNNHFKQDYHPLLPLEYYQKGMDVIEQKLGKKLKWYIVGEDHDWIEVQDLFKKCILIKNDYDPDDLWFFRYFKYMITANSSFSWWGAWLSSYTDTIVIAPRVYFGPKGPNPFTSIYCTDWIVI